MTPHLLVLVIALYVALDLSNPFMPGAFSFDAADSVEGVNRATARTVDSAPELTEVPAPLGVVTATSESGTRRSQLPVLPPSWRGTILRMPPAVRDTAAPPSAPDH